MSHHIFVSRGIPLIPEMISHVNPVQIPLNPMNIHLNPIEIPLYNWLMLLTILKNDGVRQWEG